MHIYIDTEFNEFRGALISIALVAEDRREFYEVIDLAETPGPWVSQHVLPILGKASIPLADAQRTLQHWLVPYPRIHVVADWPEDIKHFCDFLITGPGERINTPFLTMEVRRDVGSDQSLIPHNALEDARALMREVLEKQPLWR